MTLEKIKQLVAAALTFGVLSLPGFSDLLHSVGGQAEVLILTGALYTVIHGIVGYVHGAASGPA